MSQPRRSRRIAKDPEEAQEIKRGEGFLQVESRGKRITLESLKNDLTIRMKDQEEDRALIPGLMRQKNELLKTCSTKKAGNKKVTRKNRRIQHDGLRDAQALLEDFLYFQNHMHRKNRYSKIKMKEGRGWLLDDVNSISEQVKPSGCQDLLDAFDKANIGGPRHRNGFSDWQGNEIEGIESGQGPRPIRFNELHLWTPACRRRPVGFAATNNMSVEPTELVLDIDNIRQEWQRIEEVEIPEKGQEGFPYRTHIERRQQEQALYRSEHGNLRPTTASLHLEKRLDDVKFQDRFREIQILDGVFISALESSYDWRTSYDLLGPVKSGIYSNFTVSDERETIEEGPPVEDDLDTDGEDFAEKLSEAQEEAFNVPEDKAPNTKNKASKPTGSKKREIEVTLDYPYPANEFLDPPKSKRSKHAPSNRPLTLSTPLPSTTWCEETPGRREYHVSMLLSPSSPVDSPPHTPIARPAPDSIPASFPDAEISPTALAAQRRCGHNPERCRAWWSHAPDACWIVESEPPVRPRSPVLHPMLDIEVPEEEFVLPEGSRAVYEERVVDQYGVMGEGWPKVGVRVPYEPMSVDDVRVAGRKGGKGYDECLLEEGERKLVYEYHAMAAPVIPLVERKGDEEVVGVAAADDVDAGVGHRVGYESDGSDYEGDMFRLMYIQGRTGIPAQASESQSS
ncbi:hypothetical protein COCMIDRAFT_23186 [Bipolaris oryzae ATCC 44560]|uniref:Uncharacterized protein n=1 Tax=Bipolaris oryzae ATCC 44560 TaxID=930090 RepID=W6ZNX7_COCMI|nr:uncharacterized protein COCMIDRAFT_23186 [Bipolaris oryzae ATCC 44560]EUC49209.1 hypothetical protein COCMIDRAFT_23186 [Bipolaris oryzae ATCC 44560]